MLMRSTLEPEFEVFSALDGLIAIEKITTYQPDLIVMDAMMPKMSGYQLCQSLRRNARFSTTPILFVSAKASPRDREYALRIGANDFLPKPFEPLELAERVKLLMKKPGFTVHPKSMTRDWIDEMEGKKADALELRHDRLHRKEESELERFLRENT